MKIWNRKCPNIFFWDRKKNQFPLYPFFSLYLFLILEIVSVISFIAGTNNPKTFNLTTYKS